MDNYDRGLLREIILREGFTDVLRTLTELHDEIESDYVYVKEQQQREG